MAMTGSAVPAAWAMSIRAPDTSARPPTMRSPTASPNDDTTTAPMSDGDHNADHVPPPSTAIFAVNWTRAPTTTSTPARRTQCRTWRTSLRSPRRTTPAKTSAPMPSSVPASMMNRPTAPTRRVPSPSGRPRCPGTLRGPHRQGWLPQRWCGGRCRQRGRVFRFHLRGQSGDREAEAPVDRVRIRGLDHPADTDGTAGDRWIETEHPRRPVVGRRLGRLAQLTGRVEHLEPVTGRFGRAGEDQGDDVHRRVEACSVGGIRRLEAGVGRRRSGEQEEPRQGEKESNGQPADASHEYLEELAARSRRSEARRLVV